MNSLEQIVVKLKEKHQKPTVLVGGTYDILHIGHKRYLEECKKLGNTLIVHIVGDQRVKERKGTHRPINNEQDRAELVSNLKSVDDVFIYDGCTYSDEIIKTIRPDTLVLSGETKDKHEKWAKVLEEKYNFLKVKIIPVQTSQSSSKKQFSEQIANLFESFKKIKGLSWDLHYSNKILNFDYEDDLSNVLKYISEEIQIMFAKPEISEDLIVYGSIAYEGVRKNSDIDLIGINRKNKKNKKYFFRVKNKSQIIPATVRIDNGVDYYHTRFRYKQHPNSPEKYINNNFPKCWGFIPQNAFSKQSMMNKLAQLDVIECLAAVSQVMFYENKKNEFITTPEFLADKLKKEFSKTRRKELFENLRWERGLKNNCVTAMRSALNYADFWAEKIDEDKYRIVMKNGLNPRSEVYNSAYTLSHSISPKFIEYQIDKKIYAKIIPNLF